METVTTSPLEPIRGKRFLVPDSDLVSNMWPRSNDRSSSTPILVRLRI
jgi:hypothetical protein